MNYNTFQDEFEKIETIYISSRQNKLVSEAIANNVSNDEIWYDPELDDGEDTEKILHTFRDKNNDYIGFADWTPYEYMTKSDITLWKFAGRPTRDHVQSTGPLTSQQLRKFVDNVYEPIVDRATSYAYDLCKNKPGCSIEEAVNTVVDEIGNNDSLAYKIPNIRSFKEVVAQKLSEKLEEE